MRRFNFRSLRSFSSLCRGSIGKTSLFDLTQTMLTNMTLFCQLKINNASYIKIQVMYEAFCIDFIIQVLDHLWEGTSEFSPAYRRVDFDPIGYLNEQDHEYADVQ